MPKPSQEPTRTAAALGPPPGVVHHPCVEPCAVPTPAPRLRLQASQGAIAHVVTPFDATNTRSTPTLAQPQSEMAATDAWYEQYVASLGPTQRGEFIDFQFTDGDSGRMYREETLLHVITHGRYHRGNVGQVLKSISLAPPRDLYTRFLHESEPARRAA